MSDTVRIMCPNLVCRKVLAVPAAARGRTVRCKICGTNIRVPLAEKPVESSAEAVGAEGGKRGKRVEPEAPQSGG
ncbi:MAG: hypothetical protein ACF8R7_14420 [Phycisphaerales bacterium JB039]